MKTVFALAGVLALPALGDAVLTHSVKCSGQRQCSLVQGEVPGAEATGRFYDEIEETGWSRLFVKAPTVTATTGFAAGYLEGALTAQRMSQHLQNYKAEFGLEPLPPGVSGFLDANERWTHEQLAKADAKDTYWNTIRFLVDMRAGMRAGANAHLPADKQISELDSVLLGLLGDITDIKQVANETQRLEFASMTSDDLMLYQQTHGHCSAIVKLTPDGQELFVGHNTWWEYFVMLRVWKHYDFGGMSAVSMPSYPGSLSSVDDFYQMGNGLVVTETTISNFNNELMLKVQPSSLPFWLRVMAANFLAQSGPDWMETFKKHNSGTYNNLWMVVDYNKFKPGEPLVEGLFTAGEQIPGYFHYEDQTHLLSYGYFPSYNVALYPEVRKQTGQDLIEETRGPAFSYQRAPRANVFRRDQGTILGEADMQRIMRYNKFQTDPLAMGNPCNQLACRGDLYNATKKAFGAVDAKYTSYAHTRARQVVAISGPSYDDQVVFDWTQTDPAVQKASHVGQPDRFEFPWMVMNTDMFGEATPSSAVDRGIPVNTLFGGLLACIAIAAVAPLALRATRGGKDQDTVSDYHKFDKSPTDAKMGQAWNFSPGQCSTQAGSSMYSPPWDARSTLASP
eukprot:TRINITY_DN102069_c0_g1_i1.p1 TRINITY_DN102069_c0_g1~~TRINITY_DN102069_c0_g1_i1.p1  ORF type:complete len:622 (+),score=159.61 TRINITY_DN102069_c0_g1_i1:130-1995(+)